MKRQGGLCRYFQAFRDQTRKERYSLVFITFVSQSEFVLRSCVFLLKTRPREGVLQEQAEGADQALLSGKRMPGEVTMNKGKERIIKGVGGEREREREIEKYTK